MDTYYVEPIHIERGQETSYISYDKRMSVLRHQLNTLEEVITNHCLYKWAPAGAGTFVKTTGSAVSSALAPSATSTRLAIKLDDILKAKQIFQTDNYRITSKEHNDLKDKINQCYNENVKVALSVVYEKYKDKKNLQAVIFLIN
jgi:hypothetical protein